MKMDYRYRRLLVDAEPSGVPQNHGGKRYARERESFDSNMMIILAALLCALICVLGINSIVRCMLRCVGRMHLNPHEEPPPPFTGKGLKKLSLRKIPVAVYDNKDGVGSTECPICLGEFLDGEKVRVLPKCHHCFHVKCVDVWLASHSTCPTCRQSVMEEPPASGSEMATEVGGVELESGVHGDHGGSSIEEVG